MNHCKPKFFAGSSIKSFLGIAAAAASILLLPSDSSAGPGRIVTGAESAPEVKIFTARTQTNVASFFAFTPSFSGGVRVATGDVNGDGAPDIIVGAGAGGGHVKVFSGRPGLLELTNFFPFSGFSGGVFVAAGDVTGDGYDDLITGADATPAGGSGAGPHVKVFDGRTFAEVRSFFAYPAQFAGGVRVAVGDVNGDGYADIITGAGPGAGPHVKVFDGKTGAELRSFFAFDPAFQGGVFVASGDIDGDGFADIITGAGPGGSPHVKAFDGSTGVEEKSFFAYDAAFSGGVRVAAGDVDGDGRAEIVTGPGKGGAPHVKVFDGSSSRELNSWLAYGPTSTNGVFVSATSVRASRLEVTRGRPDPDAVVQLRWPAACACEVEYSDDPADRTSWKPLDIKAEESGNTMALLVPAVQKVRLYRLICDEEAIR